MKITLDPGHGRYDNKGIIPGYYEGERMFYFAYFLKAELEKYSDAEVFVTRQKVTDNPSLHERGSSVGKNGSELFISLHTNAASDSAAHGISVFRSYKYADTAELGERLGQAVVEAMKKKIPSSYLRGVFTRTYEEDGEVFDYYGVIRSSIAAGIKYSYIIEHGFHTNSEECSFMFSDENLKAIAEKEAAVIAKFFGFNKKTDEPAVEKDITYTVKKGDTLSKISLAYGVSVRDIAEYNGIENADLIFIGQKIKIPYALTEIKVGDIVQIKSDKDTYFPGGKKFNSWVHDYDYIISRTTDSSGRAVMRNGAECVLLGKKIHRETGAVYSPINSWCAKDYLIKK